MLRNKPASSGKHMPVRKVIETSAQYDMRGACAEDSRHAPSRAILKLMSDREWSLDRVRT